MGTEEMYSWNGFGAEMILRHLERLNDNDIVGHSQGGVGVINAVTVQRHKDI